MAHAIQADDLYRHAVGGDDTDQDLADYWRAVGAEIPIPTNCFEDRLQRSLPMLEWKEIQEMLPW